MPKLPKLAIGALVAVAVFLVSTVLLIFAKKPGVDIGGTVPTSIQTTSPGLQQDSLTPVGTDEASKRVAVHKEEATTKDGTYVAKPVIEKQIDVTAANKEHFDGPPAATPIPQVARPNLQTLAPDQPAPPQIAPQAQQQQQPPNTEFINKQLSALIGDPQPLGPPNFLVVHFSKPKPKEQPAGANGSGVGAHNGADGANYPGPKVLAAKPGDVFYAIINVGFNSDDPQGLPVYATIYDIHPDGSTGPLHGARLQGKVTYSDEDAAVVFNQMTLGDNTGRTARISAMAVTLSENMRPGVAVDVDRHLLSRYGSLVASTLLQGVGQVGQQLVSRVGTQTISPYGTYTSSLDFNNPSVYVPAAMGALMPLGQVFTQAFSKNFMQRPTISTPSGTDVGVVFLESVIVPVLPRANSQNQPRQPGALASGLQP